MDIAFEGYLRVLALVYVLGAYLHARRVLGRGAGMAPPRRRSSPRTGAQPTSPTSRSTSWRRPGSSSAPSGGAFVLAAGSQTVIFVAYPDLLASGEDGQQINRQLAWFHIATLLVLLVLLAAR